MNQSAQREEYEDAMAYYGHLDRQMTRLRSALARHPDPRDPDYPEGAAEALEQLEDETR